MNDTKPARPASKRSPERLAWEADYRRKNRDKIKAQRLASIEAKRQAGLLPPRQRAPMGSAKVRENLKTYKRDWARKSRAAKAKPAAEKVTREYVQKVRDDVAKATRTAPAPREGFKPRADKLRWVKVASVSEGGDYFAAFRGRTQDGLSLPCEKLASKKTAELTFSTVLYYIDGSTVPMRREVDVIRELTRLGILED